MQLLHSGAPQPHLARALGPARSLCAARFVWVPESRDIQRYLAERFGDGEVPRLTLVDYLEQPRVCVLAILFRQSSPAGSVVSSC